MNMYHKQHIINQYNKNISSYLETGDYRPYLITTMFNMTNHQPDHVEGDLLNRIKHTKKHDRSSCVLPELYRQLSDHRFKINRSLNHRIYEKDITLQRLTWCWNQYDIFQTHLVKTLIKNAGRSSKIELYPRSWDFIDVFGSKRGNHVWDDDFSTHLHSIYLIKHEIAEKFDRMMAGNFNEILWHPKLSGVRRVHGEPIGSEADDMTNVIEYAGKFAMGIDPLRQRNDLPLSFQYPITSEERLLRRRVAQDMAAA
jgi:hypothetical protein